MLEALKRDVCAANLNLAKHGLVILTWGNVSAIDRETGYVVIKPSGLSYENMQPDDMVVVDLDNNVIEGKWRQSSDTPTHLELYKAFPQIGGVVHTHSTYATAFAQAARSIPAYGTTHADYFHGDVPCTRKLTDREVSEAYEKNTGLVIVEALKGRDPMEIPAMLLASHGPFAWGRDANEAMYHAAVLEEVARMAHLTEKLNPQVSRADSWLLDKHYERKHGKNAYYGQENR